MSPFIKKPKKDEAAHPTPPETPAAKAIVPDAPKSSGGICTVCGNEVKAGQVCPVDGNAA